MTSFVFLSAPSMLCFFIGTSFGVGEIMRMQGKNVKRLMTGDYEAKIII